MTADFARFLAARSKAVFPVAPGLSTPRCFSSAIAEHLATRRAAGLFDFSFMGCVEISGKRSLAFLSSLQTRALDRLLPGRIAYTLMLRDDGSVLNDATVWNLGHGRYRLFVGRRSDVAFIARCAADFDVAITDVSAGHAVIAVQGTASLRIIERCFAGRPVPELPYFGFQPLDFEGGNCLLARIGYSGEPGYELVTTDAAGADLWRRLLAAGAPDGLLECGFDAVDTLRIEAGHLLFTQELACAVSPFELGLARLVDFYRGPFRGARALQARRWKTARRLVGLLPAGPADAAPDWPERIARGRAVMSSRGWSPLYQRWLALGYVNACDRYPGTRITLDGGTRAQVVRLPFYDPARRLARAGR